MDNAWVIWVVGIAIIVVGVAMPEQTTETIYRNGEAIEKVWVNPYKDPAIVAGGALFVLGVALGIADDLSSG